MWLQIHPYGSTMIRIPCEKVKTLACWACRVHVPEKVCGSLWAKTNTRPEPCIWHKSQLMTCVWSSVPDIKCLKCLWKCLWCRAIQLLDVWHPKTTYRATSRTQYWGQAWGLILDSTETNGGLWGIWWQTGTQPLSHKTTLGSWKTGGTDWVQHHLIRI